MTLNHKVLKKVNSPKRSPKLTNSTLRRRTLLKRLSSGGVQFGTSSKANLKVVVRVRPENQREIDNNARSVVDIVDDHMLVFDPKPEENDFFFQGAKQKFRDLSKKQHKEQKFIFEKVFNPLSTNQDVFETTTKDIIDTILNGYNCSVFAYGATGSGKTFTMIGTEACPGITFMTVMELYRKIGELENKSCEVGVSYLEVYNEMVRDLLAPGKPLNLHETKQNVQVTGLSLHKPKDADELLRILAEGNRNRSQHPTDANSESSRSHAVFQVFVRQQSMSEGATTGVSIAKLSMIDLAGSERGSATGFKGVRFREGANINKSLLALGNCINALADGKGHIPYRDSKLTRLLKDSIGGNCRSVMIATITQASSSFEDTYNTLRYANRAKTIKTTLKKNFMNVDHHVAQYVKMVEDLKSEITDLKGKLKEYEEREAVMPPSEVLTSPSLSEEERKAYEEVIEELKTQLKTKTTQECEQAEYEKELLFKLSSLNGEVKTIQKEILQLETAERNLEYKIYSQRAHIVRMNVFVFASKKLEKGVSKSERLIQAFQKNLDHVINKKQLLTEKFDKLKEQIVAMCEDFKKKKSLLQPENENDESDPLFSKLKDMEMEQTVRNLLQIQDYLTSLVQNLIQKEANSEKFLNLLLAVVKQFYLKFKLQKTCDEEVDQFLEKIYGMLDCSRIEWEDLKDTKDSFEEKIASDYVTSVPILDERKLTEFHVQHTVHFSPITYDVSKIYRSNILKPVPNNESTLNHHPPVLNETCNVETPVSSKKFSSLKGTPLSHKECLDKETVLCDSILGNEIPVSPNATFSVIDNRSPLCLPIESNTQENYSLLQEESQIAYSESEAVASQPLSPVLSCANTTITITKDSPISDKETCIKKDDDSVFCTDYDNLQASINLDVPSSASVNSGDSSQSLVNSTFSVLNPENITTTHSPKITGTYSPKLTSTHSPRERVTTLQPIQNNVFKKPMGITSSKFSFSKLPNFSSGKPQTSLSLKRSTSTSVLNSGGVGNSCGKSQIATSSGGNKENVLKKSTSFVQKNGSTSALKNKENKGVKTVAFGSSYSGTPRMKLSSKRSLTYSQLPNVTTEQSKK